MWHKNSPKSRFSIPAEVWSFGEVLGIQLPEKTQGVWKRRVEMVSFYIFLWETSMAKCSCSRMSQVCKGISYDPFLDGVSNMQS